MGIRMRSILVMGILGFMAIGILGFTSYRLSMNNALEEAKIKSDLVMNYAMASREFTRVAQSPLVRQLVEPDRFYPEIMSGFAVARGIYEEFEKTYPGYIFRQATLDPLHPSNKADVQEVQIIQNFINNPELKTAEGRLTRNGEEVFYTATPFAVMNKNCLICHGDPADAPKDQIEIYGDSNGYGWKMDEIVSAFIVYVPVADAIASAKTMSLTLVLYGAGGIIVMLVVIGWFLNRDVVTPIVRLAERTEDFSLGENLDEPIDKNATGEVGVLAQSVERLRISLNKLMQRNR
jgi:HAMP domain-containing protein